MNPAEKENLQDRRKFLETVMKAGGASLLLGTLASNASARTDPTPDFTVRDIMEMVIREVPGGEKKDTVDTIKTGSADAKVSAIVTTMFPTITVIREAIRLQANFIIAHEPSFYNHQDDRNWTGVNPVVTKKLALLNDHNITIWRCHDYWHAMRPDSITYGVLKRTGWLSYNPEAAVSFQIPPVTLDKLIDHLKDTLGLRHVRIVGDVSQTCRRISLLPGAWGGQRQIETVEKDKPDVLIVGEISEWETAEYIRDARLLGGTTSLLILGHCLSEEPGMAYMAEWLKPKVPGLQVTHIPSREPFTWL